MARAGQRVLRDEAGLPDGILVGALARTFPREAVEEAVNAAGAREQRSRMLPAWLTVYFVLGLVLFMDLGAGRVMRRLAGTLTWAAPRTSVPVPSEQALSNARARLGSAPLRLLLEKAAGPVAEPGRAGAFWRGLRLVSLDGTTLNVQDTGPNRAHFGGPPVNEPTGRDPRGAFPQARLLAVAECGTGALIAACCGALATGEKTTGEKTTARELLPRLRAGMLCLADADFACYELWRAATAAGAELLWRAGAGLSLPVETPLADGTYLSLLTAPGDRRGQGAAGIPVRVIGPPILDAGGEVTETVTLITTLADPDTAAARELADLYHARWDIAAALGTFTTGKTGDAIVLRSKTPDGAEQEIWALLCVYHAIRELMGATAALAAFKLKV
jgi:hypothetical protein